MTTKQQFRIRVPLKPITLPQRPASYQPISIKSATPLGEPNVYETLSLEDNAQLALSDGITLSLHPTDAPQVSFLVEADNKEQAWLRALPIAKVVVAGLTLALERPLGEIDEPFSFVVPKDSSGLVASLAPTFSLPTRVPSQQLNALLRSVSFPLLVSAALNNKVKNLDLALQWYHLGARLDDRRVAYISYWVGIEVLTEGIRNTGKDHVNQTDVRLTSKGLQVGVEDRAIKNLWDLRGQIVHGGQDPSEQELSEVKRLLKTFITRAVASIKAM